jgi:hypothetical protein
VEAYNCDDMMYKWVYNKALVVTGLDDRGIFWDFTVCQNLRLECNIWFLLLQKHARAVKTEVFFLSLACCGYNKCLSFMNRCRA